VGQLLVCSVLLRGSSRDTASKCTVVVKVCYKYNEYLYCKVEHTRRVCVVTRRNERYIEEGELPDPQWILLAIT
jgi:hypothetical protein